MRTKLDALVTQSSLHMILNTIPGADVVDLIESNKDSQIQLKNVCAKVSVPLSDQIDNICGLLDISKRRFLEAAFIDAVHRAHEIMEREGVFDALTEKGEEA